MNATSRFRSRSGVTAVEMLVALAILTILLGVAMPFFQAMLQNARFRAAASQVEGDVRRARALAVTRGNFAAIRITAGGTYRIEVSTNGTTWPADPDSPATNANVITPWENIPQLYTGVTLSQPQDTAPVTLNRIIFDSLGNSVRPGAALVNPINTTITHACCPSRTVRVTAVGSVITL